MYYWAGYNRSLINSLIYLTHSQDVPKHLENRRVSSLLQGVIKGKSYVMKHWDCGATVPWRREMRTVPFQHQTNLGAQHMLD